MTQFRTFTDAERAALKLHGLDTHRPSQLSDAFVLGMRYATTPINEGTVPAAVPADQVQRLLFDIRGAMLRYGVAFKIEDEDGIRTATTEACELLDRLAAISTSAPSPVEATAITEAMVNAGALVLCGAEAFADPGTAAWGRRCARSVLKAALAATHPKEPTEAPAQQKEGA
jgi:hypothetical protein